LSLTESLIGGHISSYLIEEDIRILQEKTNEKSAFPSNECFIHISRSPAKGVPIGAAIPFVQSFLDKI
jgi:N-acetylglucosamine repressor